MDLQALIGSQFTPQFLVNLISIILIDIVLAGDNSIVIAMAVQSLPSEKRMKGIALGALAAVLLRVVFTFFAAKFLCLPFVKLVGGATILWIAVALMNNNEEKDQQPGTKATTLWTAIWIILVADVTMSLDNVLAVAGASHGNIFLLLFGFGLSIPLVVFTSTLISKLMARFPWIMWLGAAVLGKVGGEMIVTDGFFVKTVLTPVRLIEMREGIAHAAPYSVRSAEVLCTAGVILVAYLFQRRKNKAARVNSPGP